MKQTMYLPKMNLCKIIGQYDSLIKKVYGVITQLVALKKNSEKMNKET